ncbi:UDP-N-acetylglucosamine 2-epimerase [Vibrio cholerae]|uniref:UDP-N-acetylglucosamine 2-epimerase n=1 Tax=Vibrio cholerae TaxID=666 RepID=UPI00068C8363|nr:UDP-N-acetylglucosamine 2-epimerase [Vibrio cholerae]NOE63415.1 UDP-N-acetylglucosamine 2-epimerase [Vibrio cholerae]BCN21035.1 UDP-N-acetylglucosamine 2-epimerase [Vibrio cholerae]GHX09794.1 UDP-N-acetylglucosamine 2-epimerase [Vibrio cholerae]
MKNNIVFFVGTTAELIKLFPIMQEMKKRKVKFRVIASGQNKLDDDIFSICNLGDVDYYLSDGKIKQTTLGLLLWFVRTLLKGLFSLKTVVDKKNGDNNIFIVHGDTISTVMGAIVGKWLGFKVCHVESGLRSYNIFKPFPEELDRIIVSKLSNIHCCPNSWAVKNINDKKGLIIDTKQNTLFDSLKFALNVDSESEFIKNLIEEKYFIFVLHRQENLYDEKLVKKITTKVINYANSNTKCLLILHSPTEITFNKIGILQEIYSNPNIITSERLGYFQFMKIMAYSQFIVTDGGSNQEESFYFGKPCLILRKETERNEGLGHNVLLSKLDYSIIDHFFSNINLYRKPEIACDVNPSEIIVNNIVSPEETND